MPAAARVTDMHTCPMVTGVVPHVGGPILPPGAPTVLIGGLPARAGDRYGHLHGTSGHDCQRLCDRSDRQSSGSPHGRFDVARWSHRGRIADRNDWRLTRLDSRARRHNALLVARRSAVRIGMNGSGGWFSSRGDRQDRPPGCSGAVSCDCTLPPSYRPS